MSITLEKTIKEKVKKIAAAQGRAFNEVWLQVILERWLVRLFMSSYTEKFIFKGGMCLSRYLAIGRETKDLDFLLRGLAGTEKNLKEVFAQISTIDAKDGFVFESISVNPLAHRHMKYPGYELSMRAVIGSTRTHLHVDIGIGDLVKPENLTISLSEISGTPIFEKEIELWAYAPESIFAEKYETAIKRNATNSRMKDYHDLIILIQSQILNVEKTNDALKATFKNRKTEFTFIPNFQGADLQRLENYWNAHIRSVKDNSIAKQLPQNFPDAIQVINTWIQNISK